MMRKRGAFELCCQKGFSLVELLVVVVILAVLAAIVIPQFSSSTDEAKLSALDSNLANFRSMIGLYSQQHGGIYPGANAASGGGAACTASGGTAGTGAANSAQAFVEQLTRYSNSTGQTCTSKGDGSFRYGPYFNKDVVPANPFTEVSTVAISTAGILGMTSSVTNGGWKYDVKTGQFIADHSNYDDR